MAGGTSLTTGALYKPTNIVQERHLRAVKHDRSLSYPTSVGLFLLRGLLADNYTLLAERRIRPPRIYCRTGLCTATFPELLPSTICRSGFFCPFGSTTPEGSGPCQQDSTVLWIWASLNHCSGKVLTSYQALACPEGSYCAGVGNVAH